MEQSGINVVKSDPRRFLDFLKSNKYAVYHRSNIFFRDFQYGLWRFLKENQTKVSYADMERLAGDVVADWEGKGMLKRINRQSFELNMPEYSLGGVPTAEDGMTETAPSKGKPAPASGPAATQAPAATDDPEKAAKLAELQAKMAAAKAKREGGDDPAPAAAAAPAPAAAASTTSVPSEVKLHVPPGTDADKAAKIAALQAKMAAAKAKREAGE